MVKDLLNQDMAVIVDVLFHMVVMEEDMEEDMVEDTGADLSSKLSPRHLMILLF